MRSMLILPVAALALTGLTACGKKAQNEAAEASESVAGDSNAMGEAVADLNAARDAAFDAAENSYDDLSNTTDNAADAGVDGGDEVID